MFLRRLNLKKITKICLFIVLLLLYCEFFVFYVIQGKCDWPKLKSFAKGENATTNNEEPVKALILTDLHILSPSRFNWIERTRRDSQMKRAFQTALYLHQPEVVFILGDLTNDGLFSYQWEWDDCMKRFRKIFEVPKDTKVFLTAGNHDIGFHNETSLYSTTRFTSTFNISTMQLISIRGNHFTILNSVALYGDECHLCKPAEKELSEVEESMLCAKLGKKDCNTKYKLDSYSRPILLQHYPLYRPSDMECFDFDAATLPVKEEVFNESRECLSREATSKVLTKLKPRVAFAGHTHHGCTKEFGDIFEFTIPSFSWRFKNNPNYGLAVFTPDDYAFVKCQIPKESSVIIIYVVGALFILFYIYTLYKPPSASYKNLSRRPQV